MNIESNPERIYGDWRAGWTLDLHTVSSQQRSDGGFDTVRTELGELLYQLKYRQDRGKIRPIAEIASKFIQESLLVYKYLAGIIPIPLSNLDRPFQPVVEVANEIGQILELPVPTDYLVKTRKTVPLKNLEEYGSRKDKLKNALQVKDQRFRGKYILVFDDLYRSGETLTAATDVLYKQGNAAKVFVLALTRTRTKR